MRKIAMPSLVSTVMVGGLWMLTSSIGRTASFADTQADRRGEVTIVGNSTNLRSVKVESNRNDLVAQLLYPRVSDRHALMVLGQGQVSVSADTARIEFLFNRYSPVETPPEATVQFKTDNAPKPPIDNIEPAPIPEVKPLTKASLKPIVDALIAIGVERDAIDVQTQEPMSGDSAKLVVKLDKPTRDRVVRIVTVAKDTASKAEQFVLQSVGVRYLVNDCQALARSAYQAAVKDARNRAEAIAQAMGVRLSNMASVAEPPFYDMLVPLCSQESSLPSFPFGFGLGGNTSSYDPNAPAIVQLRRDIFVTYPIRR